MLHLRSYGDYKLITGGVCKAMAFELRRVPFHVPGCDILSGRKNATVRRRPSVTGEFDPLVGGSHGTQGWPQVRKFDLPSEVAHRCMNVMLRKSKITTAEEFKKLLTDLGHTPGELVASCARLVDIINGSEKGKNAQGTAFVMLIQYLIGHGNPVPQREKDFLRSVVSIEHAAPDTKVVANVILALSVLEYNFFPEELE